MFDVEQLERRCGTFWWPYLAFGTGQHSVSPFHLDSQSLHRMSELVNVVVAFAVIIFLVRWATSGAIFSLSLCTRKQANHFAQAAILQSGRPQTL
jgi:hypothetical protein